jgi:hypothetical protein
VAKLNLNSVLEVFILAAGTPPSVWRTVPDHTTVATQPQARMKKDDAERQSSNRWVTAVHDAHSGRKS